MRAPLWQGLPCSYLGAVRCVGRDLVWGRVVQSQQNGSTTWIQLRVRNENKTCVIDSSVMEDYSIGNEVALARGRCSFETMADAQVFVGILAMLVGIGGVLLWSGNAFEDLHRQQS